MIVTLINSPSIKSLSGLQGKIALGGEFFTSPMDFYSKAAASCAEGISAGKLHRTMIWVYLNFYILSFLFRPQRVARVMFIAITKGREETRYAKWFIDRFVTRKHWRDLDLTATRSTPG